MIPQPEQPLEEGQDGNALLEATCEDGSEVGKAAGGGYLHIWKQSHAASSSSFFSRQASGEGG